MTTAAPAAAPPAATILTPAVAEPPIAFSPDIVFAALARVPPPRVATASLTIRGAPWWAATASDSRLSARPVEVVVDAVWAGDVTVRWTRSLAARRKGRRVGRDTNRRSARRRSLCRGSNLQRPEVARDRVTAVRLARRGRGVAALAIRIVGSAPRGRHREGRERRTRWPAPRPVGQALDARGMDIRSAVRECETMFGLGMPKWAPWLCGAGAMAGRSRTSGTGPRIRARRPVMLALTWCRIRLCRPRQVRFGRQIDCRCGRWRAAVTGSTLTTRASRAWSELTSSNRGWGSWGLTQGSSVMRTVV